MKKNTAASVAGASVILVAVTLLSKSIGFVREIVYAGNFGLSSEFDLFLVGSAVPVVINSAAIFLCQHYFVPAYNRIKKDSEAESSKFFNSTFWHSILLGAVISLLLIVFSKIIIRFYMPESSEALRETGQRIFSIFLLTVPVNAGISVITAYLQANFRFIYPAAAQVVINILIILLVVFFSDLFKIFVLPLGFAVSYFAAFLILYIPFRELLKFPGKEIFRLKSSFPAANTLITLVFIEGLSLSYILIDRYFYGYIPEGGIAALNYAMVIFLIPVSVISIPIITTIFSKFSYLSFSSPGDLKNNFLRSISVNLYLIIPSSLLLICWGSVFIKIFFERGKFSALDSGLTYNALVFYLAGLVFYSTYLVFVKLLYSTDMYKPVLVISAAAFILKIILNFILAGELYQNGLAFSTSLIYLFLFAAGFMISAKKIDLRNRIFCIREIIYFTINAVLSFFISYLIVLIINKNGMLISIAQAVIFLLLYAINSFILKDEEYFLIRDTVLGFLNRGNKKNSG